MPLDIGGILRSTGSTFLKGVAGGLGLTFGKQGMQFMGGMGVPRVLGGLAGLAGLGSLAYAVSDNPFIGVGVGLLGAGIGSGGLPGMLGRGMGFLGPAFVGLDVIQGFREEGLWGAAKGGATSLALFGAFDVGLKALGFGAKSILTKPVAASLGVAKVAGKAAGITAKAARGTLGWAFKGTAIKGFVGGALRLAMNPVTLAGTAAAIGAYSGAQKFAAYGRVSRESEFVGNMAAFATEAAYTMRQRALQEINRSHTNARTVLGNEASLMHLR